MDKCATSERTIRHSVESDLLQVRMAFLAAGLMNMNLKIMVFSSACLCLCGCGLDNEAEAGVDTTIGDPSSCVQDTLHAKKKSTEGPDEALVTETIVKMADDLVLASPSTCSFDGVTETAFADLLAYNWEAGTYKSAGKVRIGKVSLKSNVTEKSDPSYEGSQIITASARFEQGTMWNSLRLSRIVKEQAIYPETHGYETKAITFLNSPKEVQNALSAIGIDVPLSPDYRLLSDDFCGGSMQIESIDGGASLSCSFGC